MKNCVFCRIIDKQQSEDIVFEDGNTIAFVPLEQNAKGHLVVVPKVHYQDIFDIAPSALEQLIVSAKSLSRVLVDKHGATGVHLVNNSGADAGQSVFHFHLHIIPRYRDDGLRFWPRTQ